MDLKKKHWLFQKDKKGWRQVHGYISSWTFDRAIVEEAADKRQKAEDISGYKDIKQSNCLNLGRWYTEHRKQKLYQIYQDIRPSNCLDFKT